MPLRARTIALKSLSRDFRSIRPQVSEVQFFSIALIANDKAFAALLPHDVCSRRPATKSTVACWIDGIGWLISGEKPDWTELSVMQRSRTPMLSNGVLRLMSAAARVRKSIVHRSHMYGRPQRLRHPKISRHCKSSSPCLSRRCRARYLVKHRHVVQIVAKHSSIGACIDDEVFRAFGRPLDRLGLNHYLRRQRLHSRHYLFARIALRQIANSSQLRAGNVEK